jgi:hypothetical protein
MCVLEFLLWLTLWSILILNAPWYTSTVSVLVRRGLSLRPLVPVPSLSISLISYTGFMVSGLLILLLSITIDDR